MRVSARRESEYCNALLHKIDSVYLNGERMTWVIEFDTDEGWIERYVRDENGHPIVNKETDELEIVKEFGTVSYTLI